MAFNVDKYLETINQTSVSAPPAGDVRIYSKTDKMPYMKNEDGVEYPLVASGNLAFTDLVDTPSSYSTMSASGVRVNSLSSGLEFFDLNSVINAANPTGAITWNSVTDPSSPNPDGIKLWAGGGYNENVILALRMDGADGEKMLIDSSVYREPDITRYTYGVGAVCQHDTSSKPFGRSSYRIDGDGSSTYAGIEIANPGHLTAYPRSRWGSYYSYGSDGNYVTTFTVCFWMSLDSLGYRYLFSFQGDGSSTGMHLYIQAAPNPMVYQVGATTYTTGYTPAVDTWYHVALTRDSSNDVRFFIDGEQKGSTQNISAVLYMGNSFKSIGQYCTSSYGIRGRLKDFIVSRECLWTSNFTKPTTYVTNLKTLNIMTSTGQIIPLS